MQTKLSVLVPGIRTKNWEDLYNSVHDSFGGKWEIIFVGPYELPKILQDKKNIVYIEDWGTPIRCQQIALTKAQGEYITWAADDGIYLHNALDIGMKKFTKPNMLVMGKYLEGKGDTSPMKDNFYYYLNNHEATNHKFLPSTTLMLNVGIVPRQMLIDLGGWDCQFEVCPMAYNDLAIRLKKSGVEFVIQDEVMYTCDHMPGHEGDHGPVHDGQIEKDQPLFKEIYKSHESINRVYIDLDNWKSCPDKWERRFK